MKINKTVEGKKVILALEGRLDTTTAPELDRELEATLASADELIFDLLALEYVSSAGLRVILKAQKIMNAKGSMKLKNVNATIMEVFDITGFIDILTIE